MSGKQAAEPAGLAPRLLAGARLADVLRGTHFAPFAEAEIADGRDRALANRLVTTALRRGGHLDIIIKRLLERGVPLRSGSFAAQLRLGLTELLFLPDAAAHSAIFLAVEAIKRDRRASHLAGLANAVLRRAQGMAAEFQALSPELLFPEPLRSRWRAAYGAAALDTFAETLLAGAPLDLTLRDGDPALVAALGAVPVLPPTVRLAERDRPVEALPGYAEGRWWVQDVAASLPARLVDLPAGSRVLDLCAAPGGKTAQLAAAGHQVTALDSDGSRLERLRSNLERLQLAAAVVEADALTYEEPPFDAVLLDAPCSATGTFRRHPEAIHHAEALASRVALQRKLLAHSATLLKPGGLLIYCVCSLEPEEGEAQARWALTNIGGLDLVPVTPADIGGLAATTADGFLRTHPALPLPGGVPGGMDGFFAARFRRV